MSRYIIVKTPSTKTSGMVFICRRVEGDTYEEWVSSTEERAEWVRKALEATDKEPSGE